MVGLFSYFSKWISKFVDKIRHPIIVKSFPLRSDGSVTLNKRFKKPYCSQLVVETDASDMALGATLKEVGHTVVFFFWTLKLNINTL